MRNLLKWTPILRTGSTPGCPPFRTSRDLRTRDITKGIAQRLLELTGEAPSVVIAEFSRRFIDANRSAECAFEAPDAQQHYNEYHSTIRYTPNALTQQATCNAFTHCDIDLDSENQGNPTDCVIEIQSDNLNTGGNGLISQVLTWPNTLSGTNITYIETNFLLTFSEVTISGNTTITTSSAQPTPPTGFQLEGGQYNLNDSCLYRT